jgi:hypothetical protein
MTRISSIGGLHSWVNKIQSRSPDCRLVFRGQCHNIPPLPSAQRHIADPAFRRAQAIMHSSWDYASAYLLPGNVVSNDPFQRLLGSMALLQHYGFRSWFVDITSDAEIAAWFATHQYVSNEILVSRKHNHGDAQPLAHLTDRAVAVVSTAHYHSTAEDGYLLVFRIPHSHLNAFALSEIVSPSALRVHRQKGGALISPLDGQPLTSLLVDTLVIDKSIVLSKHLSTRWLFPPPLDDEVYKKLLRVPYVVGQEDLHENPLLGWPALIKVPLYIYDDHPDVETLANIRMVIGIHGPTDFSEPNRRIVRLPLSRLPTVRYTTLPEPPNEFLPRNGVNVGLRVRESVTKPVNLSVWKSRHLLLLYPIHQMLMTFMYRDDVYPLFRGLLVDIIGEHNVHLNPIDETMDHVVKGEFIAGEEGRFREDFYFLTEKLETGEATLKPKGPEYHYEWEGWDERQHEDPLRDFRTLYSEKLDELLRTAP